MSVDWQTSADVATTAGVIVALVALFVSFVLALEVGEVGSRDPASA